MNKLESRENQLQKLPDPERLEALIHLAKEFWYISPDKNMMYSREALELARKLGDPDGESQALNSMGIACFLQGKYDQALELYLNCLKLLEKNDITERLSASFNNIALVYIEMGDFEKANEYAGQSIEIARDQSDQLGVARGWNSLGYNCHKKEYHSEAVMHFQRALDVFTRLEDHQNAAATLNNIGESYIAKRDFQKAMECFRMVQELVEADGLDERIAWCEYNIGTAYIGKENYELALEYLESSLRNAKAINRLELVRDNYLAISEMKAAQSNFEEALAFYRSGIEIDDQIHTKESADRMAELQARFEVERKEKEAEIFRLRNVELVEANSKLREANRQIKKQNIELSMAQKKLEELARTDPLTGLSNRRDMLERIEHEFHRWKRSRKPFALVLADIDFFKKVNDQYGHDCGDSVLTGAAKIFRSCLRKQDLLCRWGGEEFMMLFPETDAGGGCLAAENLRKVMENHSFTYRETTFCVTATFGVAQIDGSIEACIKSADDALYAGKKDGRNRVSTIG